MEPEEVVARAALLDPVGGTREPVQLGAVEKKDGGFRTVFKFGVENYAIQLIAHWQLEASYEVPAWQYCAKGRGGVPGAVSEVAGLIESGHKWVVCADIKKCYDFFSAGEVARLLPIPAKLARNSLTAERLNLRRSRHNTGPGPAMRHVFPLSMEHGKLPKPLPAYGICQGSAAAPLAVAILLGDLDQNLPEGSRLVGYADNLFVLARTKRQAVVALRTLICSLKNVPAGRLVLNDEKSVRQASWGFEALGYHLRARGGRVEIRPSARNLERGERSFNAALQRDQDDGAGQAECARRFVEGWASSFRLWPRVRDWRFDKLTNAEWETARPRPRVRRRSEVFPDP